MYRHKSAQKRRFIHRLKHWRTVGWYDDRYDFTLKEGRVYYCELIGGQLITVRFIDRRDPMATEPWVAYAFADKGKLIVKGAYAGHITPYLRDKRR